MVRLLLTKATAPSDFPNIVNTWVSLKIHIQCLRGNILTVKLTQGQLIHFELAEVIGENQHAIVSELGH